MKRSQSDTGSYKTVATAGERFQAFVPAPLPPNPALVLDGPIVQLLEGAAHALGRLNNARDNLPYPYFLYSYVRKEAVLSSRVEGTESTLSDLLLHDLNGPFGVPFDDVKETSLYAEALEYGLRRLQDIPPSNRLIREVHEKLLSHGRGNDQNPGEFRRSQNWIGGGQPSNADFVPPPHIDVPDCMAALERFIHATDDGLPILIRVGLAHAQFETIHPFLDGNGRVGRLLISLLLSHFKMLQQPLLYLSLYFKENRDSYYDLLNRIRRDGDWEEWLKFFLRGVQDTADSAVSDVQEIIRIFSDDQSKIKKEAGRRTGTALQVHTAFQKRPILSRGEASRKTKLSYPAVASAIKLLVEKGIVHELPMTAPPKRNMPQFFVYTKYFSILNKGDE